MRLSSSMRRAMTPLRTAAAIVLVILMVLVVVAPILPLADPLEQNIATRFAPIGSPGYLMGADEFGRDVLARLILGARIEILVALSATLLALCIGTVLGLLGAYFGGIAELLMMRSMDVILAFPPIILALLITSIYGPGIFTLISVLAFLFVPTFARITYGQVLSVKALEYVEAAEVFGARVPVRLFRVILPNVAGPLLVQFSLVMAAAILLESGLSYLGLGIVPPTASLGSMVAQGQRYMTNEPMGLILPASVVSITILAFSLSGDALRDWLDPRK
jgi:peptide/nickel transport system permease protein